jgi:hypothetical protein
MSVRRAVLRLAYDHHRDLRPLESAQGTPASAKPNREASFVTRHGLDHTRAAATALRPMAPLVSDVVTCDPMLPFHHHSSTRNRAPCPNIATKLRARHAATTAEPFRASAENQILHSSAC